MRVIPPSPENGSPPAAADASVIQTDASRSSGADTPQPPGRSLPDIRELFRLAVKERASDLHLVVNMPPLLRVDGTLHRTELEAISRDDIKRLIYSVLTDQQQAQFERERELDLSVGVQSVGRFRVNVHYQRGS
ncbi:MAG: hypothetical protein HYZ88_00075, partial [Candidatus Omnitrophica bacterium]|nr:hypothetical protein [Candidatus Omnitrophota bacterium]